MARVTNLKPNMSRNPALRKKFQILLVTPEIYSYLCGTNSLLEGIPQSRQNSLLYTSLFSRAGSSYVNRLLWTPIPTQRPPTSQRHPRALFYPLRTVQDLARATSFRRKRSRSQDFKWQARSIAALFLSPPLVFTLPNPVFRC